MDNNLFPEDIEELEDVEELAEDADEIIGYKPAPYFDSNSGEFLFDGNGQIITADGVEAWKQWCENIIATDRYNRASYTDDIGIDYTEIFKAGTHEEVETMLETEIAEALECDPYGRTQFVQNITFEWISSTELAVCVEVVGLDNEIVTIDTVLTA